MKAKDIACPKCGALPTKPCKSGKDTLKTTHWARLRKLKDMADNIKTEECKDCISRKQQVESWIAHSTRFETELTKIKCEVNILKSEIFDAHNYLDSYVSRVEEEDIVCKGMELTIAGRIEDLVVKLKKTTPLSYKMFLLLAVMGISVGALGAIIWDLL